MRIHIHTHDTRRAKKNILKNLMRSFGKKSRFLLFNLKNSSINCQFHNQ